MAPRSASAQDVSDTERARQQQDVYARCLNQAQSDPEAAYAVGLSWFEAGGGLPARHCVAVALVGLGDHAEAAARLERLAQEVPGDDAVIRGGLLAQAAQAWGLNGRLDRAEDLQSQVLAVFPNDPQLRVDRALTRLSAGRNWDAIDDLNIALEIEPDDAEVLLYRAAAYRYLDVLDLARDDVARALQLSPDNPEAWLESGILKELGGDLEGARRDWAEVLKLDPNGPAAGAARARIERQAVIRN